MTMKKNRKMNIPMSIASILLCLVLFSLYMTSGMLAKYTTGGSGKGDGRVAKLKVLAVAAMEPIAPAQTGEDAADDSEAPAAAEDENSSVIMFTPGTDGKFTADKNYVVTLTNESEVAVKYEIIFKFGAGVLNYLEVATSDSGLTMIGKNVSKGTVTFSGNRTHTATLAPNGANISETFSFNIIDNEAFYAALLENDSSLESGNVPIDFDAFVDFVQID